MERVNVGDILMDDAGKEGVEVMALLEPRPYDAMEREFQQVTAQINCCDIAASHTGRHIRLAIHQMSPVQHNTSSQAILMPQN